MARVRRGDGSKVRDEKRALVSCFWRFALLFPSTLGLPFVTGCSGFNEAIGNDPLLGGPPLHAAAMATPPAPMPVAALPPAAANSTLSTAALAAGAPRPIDGPRDLRIGAPGASAGNDGWAREGSAGNHPQSYTGQAVGDSGALLRPPEAITEPVSRQGLTVVSNPGAPQDNRALTYEQAQDLMKKRGVLWQRLEMVAESGEWKYSCSIPNRQNPKIRRTYEARASEPVAAIRAVLEQLDKDQ
jgi:hypothetical protein